MIKYKEKRKKVWRQVITSLCGYNVEVIKSKSPEFQNIKGKIEDETAKMLKLNINNKKIWVQKKGQIFRIEFEDGTKTRIDGQILEGTPEKRLKRKTKNW